MTRSWDNLVSALAGAQMALGGKKWGQAGYRARPDIHPLISPTVPCTVSTSRSVHLNLEIIRGHRGERQREREKGRDCVCVCGWIWHASLQRVAKTCIYAANHPRVDGNGWIVISPNTTAVR